MTRINSLRLLCLVSTVPAILAIPPHPGPPHPPLRGSKPEVRRPAFPHHGPPAWLPAGNTDGSSASSNGAENSSEGNPTLGVETGSGSDPAALGSSASSSDSASFGKYGEDSSEQRADSGGESGSGANGPPDGAAGQSAGFRGGGGHGPPNFGGGDDGGRGGSPFGGEDGPDGQGGRSDGDPADLPPGVAAFLGFDIDRAVMFRTIHGIIAAIVFVVVFPVGAILMRIVPGRFTVLIHSLVQILGYLAFVAAVGLGLYLTQYVKIPNAGGTLLSNPDVNYHPIIGLVVFSALTLQPVFGFLHHRRFKKVRKRGMFSQFHLWIGRIFITLGIINGGLGLWNARAKKSLTISYGVVAGVVWLLWMLIALATEIRTRRAVRRIKMKRSAATTESQ